MLEFTYELETFREATKAAHEKVGDNMKKLSKKSVPEPKSVSEPEQEDEPEEIEIAPSAQKTGPSAKMPKKGTETFPASCPIDSKSHMEHDLTITELWEFKEATTLTTRRLAERVVHLEREKLRLTEKLKQTESERDTARQKIAHAASQIQTHMEKFHPAKAKP